MEYVLCNKQYTDQSETNFNLRLNKHQKYVNIQNWLQADQYFGLPDLNFNKHAIITLIKELNDTNIEKELLKCRLKTRNCTF